MSIPDVRLRKRMRHRRPGDRRALPRGALSTAAATGSLLAVACLGLIVIPTAALAGGPADSRSAGDQAAGDQALRDPAAREQAASDQAAGDEVAGDEAAIVAVYATVPPVIDGLLDDEVWRVAEPVTDFRQRNPVDGAAPSEATEVRMAFDANNIYFGLMLHDSEPDQIIAQILQREGRIDLDDRVIIALDSYDDDRSAYISSSTPSAPRATR